MSQLEIDHVFCFCDPTLPEIQLASQLGFTFAPKHTHPGQGTANRPMIFSENYLELIHAEVPEDMKRNPLRLDRRANWKTTGASPFGIALRGTLSLEDSKNFWSYRPPYRPESTILIHRDNEEHPERPFLFYMPTRPDAGPESMYPMNWKALDKSFLNHLNGTKKMSAVTVSGPSYLWPLSTPVTNLNFISRKEVQLRITVDAQLADDLVLNENLSIICS